MDGVTGRTRPVWEDNVIESVVRVDYKMIRFFPPEMQEAAIRGELELHVSQIKSLIDNIPEQEKK